MTLDWEVRKLREEFGALIEQREGRRSLREFTKYRDDPIGFLRDVLEVEPWSAQVEIAESVRDHPMTVVRSCNGAGKDFIGANLALWFAYCHRGLVLLTAPSDRQLRSIVMNEVRSSFHRAELQGELFERALRVQREDRVGIRCMTSSSASALTGHHSSKVFAILTEAQGIEDYAWEGLFACTAGQEDRLLALGNPLNPSGKFYQVNRSSEWNDIQISAAEHPNVREGREVIPGGVSPAFVSRMASEYGEGSSTYTSRVLGEFPETGQRGLISRQHLEEAAENHANRKFEEVARRVERPVAAVDPARFGPDMTCVAVRRGPRLTRLVTWGRASLMETVEKLREVLEEVGIEPLWSSPAYGKSGGGGRVVVDEVGVGAGVLDRLKQLNYDVAAFNSSRRPRNRRRFANSRAEGFWKLRELLEAGEISLPRDSKLFDELTAVQWTTDASGKVRIERKDELRNRIGRSPDRGDATMMAFTGRQRRTTSFERIGVVTWQ